MKLTLIAAAFVASFLAASAAQADVKVDGVEVAYGTDDVKHRVVCEVNKVHLVAKSDVDCKKAGGMVVDMKDEMKK